MNCLKSKEKGFILFILQANYLQVELGLKFLCF